MTGKNRNLSNPLPFLIDHFPAVAIIGPRQAGKTTLTKQIKPDWDYFDLENPLDFQLINHDPSFFLSRYERNIIIDEAQLMPSLFSIQGKGIVNWQPYYYRTRNGAEIDLILEGSFGILPIEIKYGSTVNFKQLATIRTFVKENNLPFGVLVNQSEKLEWLCEEIIPIPLGWI